MKFDGVNFGNNYNCKFFEECSESIIKPMCPLTLTRLTGGPP